ncbi:MAG TPA: molybdopterin-dependent oxidoreductase, partial [Thermodesulfobacteriota bacterium]|nr:molybdopterin-dependent oxidoreductase [Thermodesulfobacteriota bacterium]
CSRGQAAMNVLYDPDRLLSPMKRSGPRGSGKWSRISWEQACEEIGGRLSALRKGGKPGALWVEMETPGSRELALVDFLKPFSSPVIYGDNDLPGAEGNLGGSLSWGAEFPVNDAGHARLILNFGANPYEDHPRYIPLAERIIEARMNGAKMVTFDVRLSNTAGKSQEWHPLKPGTDGIVALAMAQHIFKEGLHDKEFLSRWTNCPGAKIAEHLAAYTPEEAEKASGVRAEDIRRIAGELVRSRPVTIISGRGVTGHRNGTMNARCLALLAAVSGNIDIPGGCCLPRKFELGAPGARRSYESTAQAVAALKDGKAQPEMVFCYMANPAYAAPGAPDTAKVLADEKRVPFLVVADTHLTETGSVADILLPMATYLESWNLESRPAMSLVPTVSVRQPLVSPLGKSLPIADALAAIGGRLGEDFRKAFPYRTGEELVSREIGKVEGLSRAGGLDVLKKEGVWFDPSAKPEYRSFEKKGFPTPSGKLEIESAKLREKGLPALPSYVPPEAKKESDLTLTVHRANVMTLRSGNAKWLSEILHTGPLWINPRTAEAMGFRNGQKVKVASAAGSVVVPLRFSQGIHPQVVALTEGLGHSGFGSVARAVKAKSS